MLLPILYLKIRKNWWLFVSIGLLCGLLGYIYASKQKPTYESRLTFALNDGGESDLSSTFGIASQFGFNIGGSGGAFASDNILEIILSRKVIEKTLLTVDTFNGKSFTFIEYYLYELHNINKKDAEKKAHFFSSNNRKENLNDFQDSILFSIYTTFSKQNVVARRPDKKLNIYEVKVMSNDARFSKKFTDRLIAETNAFYIEVCSKKAKQTLDVLEKRLENMKTEFSNSLSKKATVQDANTNTALSVADVPIQKKQMDIQLYGGAFGELFKNLEIARFQYLKEVPLMQIIDDADYPMKKITVSKIKTALVFLFVSQILLIVGFVLLLFIKKID